MSTLNLKGQGVVFSMFAAKLDAHASEKGGQLPTLLDLSKNAELGLEGISNCAECLISFDQEGKETSKVDHFELSSCK